MKVKTKVGDKTVYLYTKIYKLEKVRLIRLLKSKKIKPKSAHIDFYNYLVENQNLPTLYKSGKTIAKEMMTISERTVRNLKKDFIKMHMEKQVNLFVFF